MSEVFTETDSGPQGLSSTAASARLSEVGFNELTKTGGRSVGQILWEQFSATMVLVLIGAGVLAAALGDSLEATAIFSIVVLFGILGFIQEYRAERALDALKKLSIPSVRVKRMGAIQSVPSTNLVPGDMVLLEQGNIIPADCRIIQAWGLRVQESALTGEAEGVTKSPEPLVGHDLSLGDRTNMVYQGTLVTLGRAEVLVVATGMRTELGKIAGLIQNVKSEVSPLQRRLEKLGKALALVGLGLSALIAILGVLAGQNLGEMLILGVSMAVAIIPEGLPAVLTITLALGASRMFSRHALIRKLPAVETLGSVTVICSDKTGTLTQNRMTVVNLQTLDVDAEIPLASPIPDQAPPVKEILDTLQILGILCNDSQRTSGSPTGGPLFTGDPTETCLMDLALRCGMDPEYWGKHFPRIGEIAFDSTRKRMSTWHALNTEDSGGLSKSWAGPQTMAWAVSGQFMVLKGSPDGLLDRSDRVLTLNGIRSMTTTDRMQIEGKNKDLASQGKRVLGLAFKTPVEKDSTPTVQAESGLVFAGLVGILDPPRPEVKPAIVLCNQAGIRPIMITGDHPLTALAIAKDLGFPHAEKALTGMELSVMTEAELQTQVKEISVFARVSPEHKLRIVETLQNQNHFVAMTGDGVNDAPALRKANIGVAMGITGTDVAKEASQMVLTDDNFASIVSAVEEGRVIFDNIRKYIKFSLGGNAGKVFVLLLLPLITSCFAIPGRLEPVVQGLTAIQLLWLNLLCDGLLAIGLGVEHAEPGIMRRPPILPHRGVLDRDVTSYVILNGIFIGIISLGAGLWQWSRGGDSGLVQTTLFMTLYFTQMWSVLSVRTGVRSVFSGGMKANVLIWTMVILSWILQMGTLNWPVLQTFLGTKNIPWTDLVVMMGLGLLILPLLEVQKAYVRWQNRLRVSL